jgi:glycosyltransferase involved in cell wall biosynthesis
MASSFYDKGVKVVFFDCVVHFGGSIQVTVQTIGEMKKYIDVVVLDAYGVCKEYHDRLEELGIKTIVIQPNPRMSILGKKNLVTRNWRILSGSAEMLQLIWRLRRVIEDLLPQAIWTTSNKGLFFLHHSVKKNIPIIYFAHGMKTYPRWYTRRAWKRLSSVVGVSENSLAQLLDSPYEPPIVEVIHNGLDIRDTVEASKAEPTGIPPSSGIRLLFVGTLNKNKNQPMAFKGLAKYIEQGGDATLWLCGDYMPGVCDQYFDNLKGLAKELGISDRIYFLGWRKDVLTLIRQCDVAILTSISEGLPMCLLEAMCLKKPVIATRVGGVPELVRDGIDGFLVELGDIDAFVKAITILDSAELRKRMGCAGFERVNSCFSLPQSASRFLEAVRAVS